MKLFKQLNSKFSIVLTLAMTFIATTTVASAQGKFVNSGAASLIEPQIAAASASRHPGGILVGLGDGSVRFSAEVFEVLLPNSPLEFDRVDLQDPNAATKIRMLFDAAYRMRRAVVLTVPKNSIRVPSKFQKAQFSVEDNTETRLEIKMEDVLVSSWSSGSGVNDSVAIKFTSLKFK